ncbi:hypothetical protein BDV93DRAFT_479506 [Ceratobasidium sp. AG-I]|nr:hypothetical protein BDV93DRAFT_479506 [Ceratobasidium sp. AG-I]
MRLTRAMAAAQKANGRQSDAHPSTSDSHISPSRKRARTAGRPIQRTGGRNTGTLRRIFDLPIEIFNEITSYLTPTELLSLARSNKFFRRMFMSRSSIEIWRSAFRNLTDLPPCPPGLSEPHYASLLFSKTCSECGARVLRRMDSNLLVKLCSPCRDEMVEVVEDGAELWRLLPNSERIFPFKVGHVSLLRRDWQAFLITAQDIPTCSRTDFLSWYDSRTAWLKEREELAGRIDWYLDRVEEERNNELLILKNKRLEDIKNRLLEKGWSNRDMQFPPHTTGAGSWLDLVFQPKPLTDRIWANIYPKLVRLLKANRSYHEEEDKTTRLNTRLGAWAQMAMDIEAVHPPMVRVTLHAQTSDESIALGSSVTGAWTEDRTFALGMPFPNMTEVSSWRLTTELVDPDVSVDEMRPEMEARRGALASETAEWRSGFLARAMGIWRKGQPNPVDSSKDEAGSSTSKTKPVKRVETRRSVRHKPAILSGNTASQPEIPIPTLPRCTVEFTKADNTTTTDITDLPEDVQILLRADTVFFSEGCSRFYPGILPDVRFKTTQGAEQSFHSASFEPWGGVERDDNASGVARALLRRLGLSNATYAEMMVFGAAFSCQRCPDGLPIAWNDLVNHFATEQSHWAQAQTKLSTFPSSPRPVFHNTHDLADPSPCVQVLAPAAALELEDTIIDRGGWLTQCKVCDSLEIEARYIHHLQPGFRSNIIAHLMSAHEIQEPVDLIHFQVAESDWYTSSSDDGDGDEDDESDEN